MDVLCQCGGMRKADAPVFGTFHFFYAVLLMTDVSTFYFTVSWDVAFSWPSLCEALALALFANDWPWHR
eukprot:scaffold3953_cov169-Amphora_coffeaeformis.AAC.25